ncbi:MAG TPA: HAMP domain-containing protein [Bacilli bacterium]|nr:HAMP domain-containing protein [Bacilli bacterium]
MRTLYFRIVATFVLVAFMSGFISFLLVNQYYQTKLKEFNEMKILEVAKEIASLYEHTTLNLEEYLTKVANMNFQLYVVDEDFHGTTYGESFREYNIDEKIARDVLQGNIYRGISEYNSNLFVTGFFKDEVKNSIGLPINIDGKNVALFVRPNIEKQFGEIRIIFALLLILTFLFSIFFIFIFTRFIVRPIKELTKATKIIASGNYHIQLDGTRKDEIGALARHFSSMAKSLQKLDEMRQEFVSNVSHEIQSPLTSIQGFSRAIRTTEMDKEEVVKYLTIIEKESERLSSLSKQLLMLSSLDKEVHALKKIPFRLDEQIRKVILMTEWQWQQKKMQFDIDLPEIVIEADKQLLYQVWLNLITNSIKFSDENGIISIRLFIDKDKIISIRDNGIGIAEDDLPHLFERFYKADKSRNRTRSGSGLGLAVVKKIVELHGGSIEVASELGEGTTFTVRLP